MLSLKNISRIYKRKQSSEDVTALNEINLNLPDNGFVTIVGASGSGKTTLLNIIGGLDRPTSGELIIDNISSLSFKESDWDAYRNEKVGFVLQNCYLLSHLSIRDNIAVKLQISGNHYKNISELVDKALEEVDLVDKKNDKPKALSGGQKQRVAIARAIVGNPSVILADEPTGALDSKNGRQIMEILKRLSKDRLVVMVSHNKEYAEEYSDRIVELKDGAIIKDTAPLDSKAKIKENDLPKVSFPFLTSLKWGMKNLVLKLGATLSIVIASALGLAGVGLILSTSEGVKDTFKITEQKSLAKNPIKIVSYAHYDPQEGEQPDKVPYTDEQAVYAELGSFNIRDHRNFMSSDFLTYMDEMPREYYTTKYKGSQVVIKTVTTLRNTSTQYKIVNSPSSYFYKGANLEEFTKNEYDCLDGSYPTSKFDVAIVIDKYNFVDASVLNFLGFNVPTTEQIEIKINFNEIVGKVYKYISNNDVFTYNTSTGLFEQASNTQAKMAELYANSTIPLRISGILREKRDADNPYMRTGLIFSEELVNYAVEEANHTDVVVAQKASGYDRNVLDGSVIDGYQSGTTTYSKEFEMESLMYSFGATEEVFEIRYFTDTFDSRYSIKNYFDKYDQSEREVYTDIYAIDDLENVSYQFDGAMSLMTMVLYAFAFISIFVSAVLNGILTYISVRQRTNEIGLLRSLGARKFDIGMMVETESIIGGLLGAALSIVFCLTMVDPINKMLTKAIYDYKFYLLSKTTFTLPGFQWWVAPIILGVGAFVAFISALIPSIIASKKDPARAINE